MLNGKMDAFASFAEIYARETKSAIPELSDDMDRVMEQAEGFEKGEEGIWKKKERSGAGPLEIRNGNRGDGREQRSNLNGA